MNPLNTYLDHTLLEDIHFSPPVTLTIHYNPQLASNLDPATLRLSAWNGTAWNTDGITFVSNDSAKAAMIVTVSHFGEFAVFGDWEGNDFLYLPALYVVYCNFLTCGASAEPVMVEPADLPGLLPADLPEGLPVDSTLLYLPAVDRR